MTHITRPWFKEIISPKCPQNAETEPFLVSNTRQKLLLHMDGADYCTYVFQQSCTFILTENYCLQNM